MNFININKYYYSQFMNDFPVCVKQNVLHSSRDFRTSSLCYISVWGEGRFRISVPDVSK